MSPVSVRVYAPGHTDRCLPGWLGLWPKGWLNIRLYIAHKLNPERCHCAEACSTPHLALYAVHHTAYALRQYRGFSDTWASHPCYLESRLSSLLLTSLLCWVLAL